MKREFALTKIKMKKQRNDAVYNWTSHAQLSRTLDGLGRLTITKTNQEILTGHHSKESPSTKFLKGKKI